MISNEHPEILERCMPNPALRPTIDLGMKMLSEAGTMRVASDAGTDLIIDVTDAPGRGGAGYLTKGTRWVIGPLVFAFVSLKLKPRTEPSSWTVAM